LKGWLDRPISENFKHSHIEVINLNEHGIVKQACFDLFAVAIFRKIKRLLESFK